MIELALNTVLERLRLRPMDAAPLDGTTVLLYGGRLQGEKKASHATARWQDGRWMVGGVEYRNPKGWLPVPNPWTSGKPYREHFRWGCGLYEREFVERDGLVEVTITRLCGLGPKE